jgi:hypothetical protein
MLKHIFILALSLSLIACSESEGENEKAKADEDVPTQSAPPALTDQVLELKQRHKGRDFTYTTTTKVPEGWSKNVQRAGNLRFYPKGSSGLGAPFLAVVLDCGGQCTADKMLENIQGMAKTATKFNSRMKIVREEKIKDGTWLYVLEGKDTKNAKTMHWQKGWPRILSCEFATNSKTESLFEPLLQACLDVKVSVLDPYYPQEVLAKEEANLAKCPKGNTLTFKDTKTNTEPYDFTKGKAYAHPGLYAPGLALYFPNVDTTQKRFNKDKTLKEGQAVMAFRFSEKTAKGEPQKPTFSGDYELKYEAAKRVTISLKLANGSSQGWSSRNAKGGIKIIARTKTKLCGTVDISGGNRGDVTGTFNVNIL